MNNKKISNDLYNIYNNTNNETLDLPNRNFIYYLLMYNFNIPNIKDTNNNTLLQHMIIEQDFIGINLLLNNTKLTSNYLNNQNNDGSTALHLAIKCDLQDIAKLLHKLGSKTDIINNEGYRIVYINNDENDDLKNNVDDDLENKINYLSELSHQNSDSFLTPFINFLKEIETNLNDEPKTKETKIEKDENFINYLDKISNELDNDNNKRCYEQLSDTLNLQNILQKDRKYDEFDIRNIIIDLDGGGKQSTQIHDEVINIITQLGYSAEEAIYIKAALYSEIKNKYSNESNLKKAQELKKITTKSNIDNVDISKWKKIVQDAKKKSSKKSESLKKPKKTSTKKSKRIVNLR